MKFHITSTITGWGIPRKYILRPPNGMLEPPLMKRLTIIFSVVLSVMILGVFTSFAHSAPLKFDSNVPADLKTQILADFTFIGSIRSDSQATPMHQQIFGAVDGTNYLGWF